jgi:hypothetical protein
MSYSKNDTDADNRPQRRVFSVKVAGMKKRLAVEADYFRIDCGTLVFRNTNPHGGYPCMVRCFAAGMWVDVQ